MSVIILIFYQYPADPAGSHEVKIKSHPEEKNEETKSEEFVLLQLSNLWCLVIIFQTLNFGGLTQMKQPYKEKYRATNSILINEPKPSY